MKLSVVISAYNAQETILRCLESVKDLADEIILVDNSSTDSTNSIARKYTKKIYKRENNPMLNVNKNFGISKATGDWVLYLDSDEECSPELQKEIGLVLRDPKADGYFMPRKNIIFNKWIQNSIWWPDYQMRLFRKGKGKYPEVHVHEKIEVTGETANLENPLIHYNYNSITQWIQKMDQIYTENEVQNLIRQNKKVTWVDAIRFPADDFLKTFFAQKGYKDGLHGLVLSILQAFYSEVIFAKLWEKQGFEEENSDNFLDHVHLEFGKIGKELTYWFSNELIHKTKNPLQSIRLRLKRKSSS